jgi:hypothetical protein
MTFSSKERAPADAAFGREFLQTSASGGIEDEHSRALGNKKERVCVS